MSQNSTILTTDSITPCQLKSTSQDYDYVFDNFSSLFSITFSKVATPPSKDPSKSLLFLFESIAVQDIRRKQALKHDHQVKSQFATSSQSSHSNHDIQSIGSSQKQYQIQQTQQETKVTHSDESDDLAKKQQNSQAQQSKKKKRLSIIVGSPSTLGNQERTNNMDTSQLSTKNANNSHTLNVPNTHSRSRSNIQFDSQNTQASEKQHTDEFKNQQSTLQINNIDGKNQNPNFQQPSSRPKQLQQISSFLKAGTKGNSKRKILKISSKPPQLFDPSSILEPHAPQFSEIDSSLPRPNPSSCNNIVLINPNNAQNYFLQNSGNFDKTDESKKLQNTQPISKKTFTPIDDFNKTGKITSTKENIPVESRGVAVVDQTKNAPSIFSMTSKITAVPNSQGRSIFPSTATYQENKKPLALASLTSKYQNSSKQHEGLSNAIKFSSTTFGNQQDKKSLASNESAPFKRLPSCMTNYTLAEHSQEENTRHDSRTRNSSRDHSINGIKTGKNQQFAQKNPRFHIRNLANPISSVKSGATPQLVSQNSNNNNNQKKIVLGGSKTANSSLNQNEMISNIRG